MCCHIDAKLHNLKLSVTLQRLQFAAGAAASEMLHAAVLLSVSCIQLTSSAPGFRGDQPAGKHCEQPGSHQLKISGNVKAGIRDMMLTKTGSFSSSVKAGSFSSFGPEWKVRLDLSLPAGQTILQDQDKTAACQASGFSALLAAMAPTLKLGRLAWQADSKQLSAMQLVLASVILQARCAQQHAATQSSAAAAAPSHQADAVQGLQPLSLFRSINVMMDPVTASWDTAVGILKQSEEPAGADSCAFRFWLNCKRCNDSHPAARLQP